MCGCFLSVSSIWVLAFPILQLHSRQETSGVLSKYTSAERASSSSDIENLWENASEPAHRCTLSILPRFQGCISLHSTPPAAPFRHNTTNCLRTCCELSLRAGRRAQENKQNYLFRLATTGTFCTQNVRNKDTLSKVLVGRPQQPLGLSLEA